MIVGIGIDIVEVKRCADWYTFADVQLAKIFHPHEIAQIRSKNATDVTTFIASRFAVKEAFFKAYSSLCEHFDIELPQSLWRIAPLIFVTSKSSGAPSLISDLSLWATVPPQTMINTHLSISHEAHYTIAQVILEKC
jgi:phosphopantetheine--protein transferase-like protein